VTVTLDGTASRDPDGNTPLTYSWVQTGGTNTVTLNNPNTANPTFTAPDVGTTGGSLTFSLTVKDSKGLESTSPDSVTITVRDKPPPPTNHGVDLVKALNFIKNSYRSNPGLLEEAPGFNVYWLWNDQLLGQIALKHLDPVLAQTIENKMNSYGVTMRTPWATLDPQYRNNFSVRGASEPTISTNPPIRYSDYNHATIVLPVTAYADIAFLSAIHHHYNGNASASRTAYDAGKAMWNGQGMEDDGNITGEYAVYKVALGVLAEKLTGFPTIGIPANWFAAFQNANGGITTDKTGGVPQGSQNVETTAAVLFALNPLYLQPPTNQPPAANAGADQTILVPAN
jgi:hypothetical protein